MIVSGVSIHGTEDMEAAADEHGKTAWVALKNKGGSLALVVMFIQGANAFERAQRMADAINAALVEPVAEQEQV